MAKPTIAEAIKVLQENLSEDKNEGSYYYSWQANIAMAFVDEMERYYKTGEIDRGVVHTVANNAAKNFLDLLIK